MSQEHDVDRHPASDYGVTMDDETSWFFEQEQRALTIVHRADDVWTVAIVDYLEGLEEG